MEKLTKDFDAFKRQKSIVFWLKSIANRSDSTKREFLYKMRSFCSWIDKTPDELYAMRAADLKNDDERERHSIENELKSYIAYLKDKGRSYGTMKGAYAAVRSFFEYNFQRLDLRRGDAPSGESIGKRQPEKSEIRDLMDTAKSVRDRALLSFAKDCGWRLGDISSLTWGDIKDLGEGFWNFKKLTQKRKILGQGFVGPETTKLMLLYRKLRERGTLKIRNGKGHGGIPPEIISDSSPLFVVYGRRAGRNFKPMRAKRMSFVISNAADDATLEEISAHSLRKYFQAQLEDPKLHIRSTWVKQMMGKKISGSEFPYVEKRMVKLFQAYKSAYSNLVLIEEVLDESERRIQAILDAADLADLPKEKIAEIRHIVTRQRGKVTPEEVIEMVREVKLEGYVTKPTKKKEDCNGDCQIVIAEDQLDKYLVKGWRYIAQLPSGRLVIER